MGEKCSFFASRHNGSRPTYLLSLRMQATRCQFCRFFSTKVYLKFTHSGTFEPNSFQISNSYSPLPGGQESQKKQTWMGCQNFKNLQKNLFFYSFFNFFQNLVEYSILLVHKSWRFKIIMQFHFLKPLPPMGVHGMNS